MKAAHSDKDNLQLVEEYVFDDSDLMRRVLGPDTRHTATLSHQLGIQIGHRGDTVIFRGRPEAVTSGLRVFDQLVRVCKPGKRLKTEDLERGIRILTDDPHAQLDAIFNDVVHVTASRGLITPKGRAQKTYVDTIRQRDLTFGVGPAGTGKTYLAVAVAVSDLLSGRCKRIVLTRPAVEAGEKLGFLPGDMVEKVGPYVRPLYDALNDMMDPGRTNALMDMGQIEIAPLAFMRGRTLNDSFVILDEAQNTTPAQMKMFLTRLGYSSKAVVTGDVTQVDLPRGAVSGMIDAMRVLQDVEGIGVCRFSDVDVVRHELVQRIIRAYEQKTAPPGRGLEDENDGQTKPD